MGQRTVMAIFLGLEGIAMMMNEPVSALYAMGCGMIVLHLHRLSKERKI